MKEFLDEVGGRYIVQRVKQMINAIRADCVTKDELQAELEALDINIDLSAYATKEELTNALSNIDLSAYATKEYVTDAINNAQLSGDSSSIDLSIYAKKSDLDSKANTNHTHTMSDITDYTEPDLSSYAKKTDIPSLDGYALKTEIPSIDGLATTQYVDNAIANVPSGGNVDLSNYYTKAETYNKTEVDTAIENAIYGSYTFDPNFDFSGKTLYFDTTKNLASMLPKEQYILYISDPTSTGYNYGQSIGWNKFSNSPNGRLTLAMMDDASNTFHTNIILYDINCADGETSQMGTFNNHWATSSYTFSSKFKTPVYGDFGDPNDPSDTRRSILGEELFNAFMSCVTRVVDADGNEVSFKILNKPEEIISPTVSITETNNGHTVSITDVNGTQSFDVTNGTNGTDGTNGTNGVSPTVTVTKEGKVATITCTDVNGTTTATISDGADGSGGGNTSGGNTITYAYDTEIATGETWVDGKPIYLKVFHVDKLSSAPSDCITYDNYFTDIAPFADKFISVEPLWSRTSNKNTFSGNVMQAFQPPYSENTSGLASCVKDNMLSYTAWVQAWQGSTNFGMTVCRGKNMWQYSVDIFVKYTKL